MDEPDDECLAPSHEATDYNFVSPEKVKGVTKPQMKKDVRNILCCKYVSNKSLLNKPIFSKSHCLKIW
jgi:hypothetical protein